MGVFTGDTSLLRPADAVCAILLLSDGRYVLQMRDDKPGIFFPGHWGLFGGKIEDGEAELDALRRELSEEIGMTAQSARHMMTFQFDLAPLGLGTFARSFFEIRSEASDLNWIRLGEGCRVGGFTREEVLNIRPVTPYDGFALWIHANQTRIIPT